MDIIDGLNKYHKLQSDMTRNGLVNFIDCWIDELEAHKEKYDYDIGVTTGMLRAFRLVKKYISEDINGSKKENKTN